MSRLTQEFIVCSRHIHEAPQRVNVLLTDDHITIRSSDANDEVRSVQQVELPIEAVRELLIALQNSYNTVKG